MQIQELQEQISNKERELLNLNSEFEELQEKEKQEVLKSKSAGMTKSLYLLSFSFESSSGRTTQYLEFHKFFSRELKQVLKPYIKEIQISKPNHFDITGFFKMNDNRIYYFSVGDLRWNKEQMLIRIAKDFKDYSGGSNGFISLDKNFIENLLSYLKRNTEFDKVD